MKAQTLRQLRRLHHYFGVFLAPAILFFALSGAVQTFHLHEDKGWGGPPPAWLAAIGSVHKDQVLPDSDKPKKGHSAQPAPDHDDADAKPDKDHADADGDSALPLKIFVLVMSIGLIVSTVLGIIIALNNTAMRRISIILLAAGTLLPILLLAL